MHPFHYAASNPYVDVPVVLTISLSDAGSFCAASLAAITDPHAWEVGVGRMMTTTAGVL